MNFIRVLIKMSSYESPDKSQLTISRRGKKFRHVATGMVSGLSVGFLRGLRVDATRDVGQRHVVSVMRRDTFGLNSLCTLFFLLPLLPFSFSLLPLSHSPVPVRWYRTSGGWLAEKLGQKREGVRGRTLERGKGLSSKPDQSLDKWVFTYIEL